MTARFVWSTEMDARLVEWLEANYGSRTPDPDQVKWRDAVILFPQAKSEKIRKRFLGVLAATKRDTLTEEEAQRLIHCIKIYGFAWEEMAKNFEGRTGLQLKNYYYTAKRRFERRQQGLKYQSKTNHPTIDEYFEQLSQHAPDEMARSRKRARSASVEEAPFAKRVEESLVSSN